MWFQFLTFSCSGKVTCIYYASHIYMFIPVTVHITVTTGASKSLGATFRKGMALLFFMYIHTQV